MKSAQPRQNWKGWLVSSALTLAGSLIKRGYRGRIPLDGLSIDVTRAPVSGKIVYRLFTGAYERPERDAIARYLDPTLPVIELGASIGVVTCTLRRALHPGVPLIALEANPQLIAQIEHNLQRNHLDADVVVSNHAIAYDATVARLQLAAQTTGAQLAPDDAPNTVSVPAITLSALLEQYNIADYTLVSDIEGGEAALLLRDPAAFTHCRQIIIELHDTPAASITTLHDHISTTLGYRLQHQAGRVFVFSR